MANLPDDVICNIAIYADETTLYSNCDQASELESDLQDTVDWGRKWLVDFNSGKSQLVSFDRSKNTGAIDVSKMDITIIFLVCSCHKTAEVYYLGILWLN